MFDYIATGRYWDKPWSLVSGCTRISDGCKNCWALAMEKRFRKPEVEDLVTIHSERLDIPLTRKKPTAWAVWNDAFHEDVPFEFVQAALARTTNRSEHIFLWLTKRPKRMAEFWRWNDAEERTYRIQPGLKQNWLGVTVCNQAEAEEKIPILLQIPAAVRWVSIEPMLAPIDLLRVIIKKYDPPHPSVSFDALKGWYGGSDEGKSKIDWVVIGGETGPGARPMHPDWVRSVRDQCQAAGVPFFFKQWGEWAPRKHHGIHDGGRRWGTLERDGQFSPFTTPWNGRDDAKSWDGLHEAVVIRVGKKAAGRLLDRREWNEIPFGERKHGLDG